MPRCFSAASGNAARSFAPAVARLPRSTTHPGRRPIPLLHRRKPHRQRFGGFPRPRLHRLPSGRCWLHSCRPDRVLEDRTPAALPVAVRFRAVRMGAARAAAAAAAETESSASRRCVSPLGAGSTGSTGTGCSNGERSVVNTKQKLALLFGGILLVWWWLKGRSSTSTGSTSSGLDGVSGFISTLAGRASSNPLSDFQGFLGLTDAMQKEPDPTPPADSWVWSGLEGNDKDIIVSMSVFEMFDKSKCGSLGCGKYGRPCTRGIDCLPSDPNYQG